GRAGHPRLQRRAPANTEIDPAHHDRRLRRDDEDQYLRAILDYQSGVAALAAGLSDYRHNFGAGNGAVARHLRLCDDESRDDELHSFTRETTRAERQTRWTQNPVIARSCGFDPLRRHSPLIYPVVAP